LGRDEDKLAASQQKRDLSVRTDREDHSLDYLRKKLSSLPGHLKRAFLSLWIVTAVLVVIKIIRVTK